MRRAQWCSKRSHAHLWGPRELKEFTLQLALPLTIYVTLMNIFSLPQLPLSQCKIGRTRAWIIKWANVKLHYSWKVLSQGPDTWHETDQDQSLSPSCVGSRHGLNSYILFPCFSDSPTPHFLQHTQNQDSDLRKTQLHAYIYSNQWPASLWLRSLAGVSATVLIGPDFNYHL